MTAILALPAQSAAATFANNADWSHAWAFAASGSAIDITGVAFRMQVRLAADRTQIALDLSTANGGLVSGGATGALTLAAPAASVAQLAAGAYVADLIATADGHTVNLYAAAPMAITVNEGVTR